MKRRLPLLALAIAVPATALVWLIATGSGLAWLAGRIERAFPGLSIGATEGSLLGGIRIRGLAWQDAQQSLTVARASLSMRWLASLGGTLRADAVVLEGVDYHRRTESAGRERAEASPPELPALVIDTLVIEAAQVVLGAQTLHLTRAQTGLAMAGSRIALEGLHAAGLPVSASGRVLLDLRRPFGVDSMALAFEAEDAAARRWRGRAELLPGPEGAVLDLSLDAPVAARARIAVDADGRARNATLQVPEQDGAPLGLDGAIAAALSVERAGGGFVPSGRIAWRQRQLDVTGGAVTVRDNRLTFEALALTLAPHGSLRLDGSLPLDAEAPMALDLTIEDFGLDAARTETARARGRIAIAGTRARPRFEPELVLSTPGWPEGRLRGRATVEAAGLRLEAIELAATDGRARIDGLYAWRGDSALRMSVSEFDPAGVAPDWPGRIDAELVLAGRIEAGRPRARAYLVALDGTLRGQRLAGGGELAIEGWEPGPGQIAVAWGDARLRARFDPASQGELVAELPRLGLLLPQSSGRARLALRRSTEDHLELAVSDAIHAGVAIVDARLDARRGRGADPAVTVDARIAGARYGPIAAESAQLRVGGSERAHTAELELRLANGAGIAARVDGARDARGWRGRWTQARIDGLGEPADLSAPVTLALTPQGLRIEEACWRVARGEACLSGDGNGDAGTLAARLSGLSLAALRRVLAGPRLPEVEGLVDGEAALTWRDRRIQTAGLALTSPRGIAVLPDREDLELGYRGLGIEGRYEDGAGTLSAVADLVPAGRITFEGLLDTDARGQPGWDASLTVAITDLSFIEAFTTALADPVGDLRGQFRIQGGWRPQSVSGAVALTGFTALAPALAIRLRDGVVAVAGVPGQLLVRGSVRSGDGTLTIDGRVLPADPVPARLLLAGENVRFANTPTLMVIASPDLRLELRDGRWQLEGSVAVPRARVDAARLEAGAQASADVIVVDDAGAVEPARPWQARVRVNLGSDVRLSGFGFDGSVAGSLDIRQRQGAQALATGEITLSGRYEAYGQRLDITRGGLRYANSPLGEPSIDLRAERRVRDQTVALEVTGSVLAPQSRIVGGSGSDADALALLVTGRPLSQVDSADRERLGGAASALGVVGGDLLARQLRGRLGLDEFGVRNDTRLDGEAFTLGKFLSPRLYVGYGIGLVTRGELFTVRYLVTDRLDVEASTGASTRAALNWRIER